MQFEFPENRELDLANEISLLIRAGCTVTFRPGYGLTVCELIVSPPNAGASQDYGGEFARVAEGLAPSVPYRRTFNIVTNSTSIAKALRNARLFLVRPRAAW